MQRHWMFLVLLFVISLSTTMGQQVPQTNATLSSPEQAFTNLYNFIGGADGSNPWAGVVRDAAGNLYGTTQSGGDPNCYNPYGTGCGTVFKIDRTGKHTLLHSFSATGEDGNVPYATLVRDGNGNLYGTTYYGGSGLCNDGGGLGCGTVFKVNVRGEEMVLYSFNGPPDGAYPWGAGLVQDFYGNLYGTTYMGGVPNGCNPVGGCGTVFAVSNDGNEKVLYSFGGTPDGAFPATSVVLDPAGRLYGTTDWGGASNMGSVFRLSRGGVERVLHSFTGGPDGGNSFLGFLIRDAAGDLYGATTHGGNPACNDGIAVGCGVVYKLDPSGKETVLYTFTGGADGAYPNAGLARDEEGNLYGTTGGGGAFDMGAVFRLDTRGSETVLHSFWCATDGCYPNPGLVRDAVGNLYGTCPYGGAYWSGTVFKLTPPRRHDAE